MMTRHFDDMGLLLLEPRSLFHGLSFPNITFGRLDDDEDAHFTRRWMALMAWGRA